MSDHKDLWEALGLPRIDEATLATLANGLDLAMRYQATYQDFRAVGTFKAVREEVPRLHRALAKLAAKKGTQQAAIKSLTGAIQSAKDYCPGIFAELDAINDLQLSMPVCIDRSVFERHVDLILNASPSDRPAMADELSNITAAWISSLKQPGRGGARKQAREYIDGLHELARQFSEAMPEHSLSADQNSVFYRYALHFLNNHMGANVTDPERHISNALDEYAPTGKSSL